MEGTLRRVAQGLCDLAAEYETDEVLVVTTTHDYADRLRSYELLAEAVGLIPREVVRSPVAATEPLRRSRAVRRSRPRRRDPRACGTPSR